MDKEETKNIKDNLEQEDNKVDTNKKVDEILKSGTEVAKKKAEETMTKVKKAIKINYFD